MTFCTHCDRQAAWTHDDLPLCGSHVVDATIRTGRPARRLPVADLVDRLLSVLVGDDLCREAADEIRRLRARVAELESGQSASARPLATSRTLDG